MIRKGGLRMNKRKIELTEEHFLFILGVFGTLIDNDSLRLDLEGKLQAAKIINEMTIK